MHKGMDQVMNRQQATIALVNTFHSKHLALLDDLVVQLGASWVIGGHSEHLNRAVGTLGVISSSAFLSTVVERG